MRAESPEDRGRPRWLLIVGIAAAVLALISLVAAILDPGWLSWWRTASLLATSLSCLLTYRDRRSTQ